MLERANSLLLTHYQNELDVQMEKMRNGANKDTVMEFIRLKYIMSRLEDNKNLKQLEDESCEYAKEIISAGNRLAIVLGIAPLE